MAQDLSFSVSPETVAVSIASGESYGADVQYNTNSNFSTSKETLTGGEKETKSAFYRYPLKKLEASDDYIEIRVRDYVPPGVGASTIATATTKGEGNNGEEIDVPTNINTFVLQSSTQAANQTQVKTKYRIQLPIPSGIQDTNQVGWGEDRINSFEAFGVSETGKFLRNGSLPNAAVDAFKNILSAGGQLALSGGQDLVANYIAESIVNNFGGNVSAQGLLTRATGNILNPNLELLFNNVTLRNFTFTFDFAPRERAEAIAVKNIIRIFKQSMSPKTTPGGKGGTQKLGNGVFISSPDVFEIEYKSGSGPHPFLNRFKPCVLLNMGVNYTASGPYATYNDATPVHMQMTLQFSELNPIYYEDYNGLTDQEGVGY
jgi:hypothetical protein